MYRQKDETLSSWISKILRLGHMVPNLAGETIPSTFPLQLSSLLQL